MALNIPLQKNRGCQELIKEHGCKHSSWLRKKSFWNKRQLFKWPQVYVVLNEGCVYYYKNETANTPSGSFSLYGYNIVSRVPEVTVPPWVFKIVHAHTEYKTYFFSASSEVEMKDWMTRIKREMKWANNINLRTSGDGKETDSPLNTYNELETKIYDDASQFLVPQNYGNRRNNDFEDDNDIYRFRDAVAPTVPSSREKKKRTDDMKQVTDQMNEKLVVKKKASFESKGMTRGSPDGASFKKKTVQEVQEVEDPDDLDPEKYWGSIYFNGADQEKANEIIRKLGEDGVYLVRDTQRSADEKVLVVNIEQIPRKFRLLRKDGTYFLDSNKSITGRSIAQLVNYYYDECLPKYKVSLTIPYMLHPMFKSSML